MGLCLIAVLGTGLLCSSGEGKTVVVSDFCEVAGPQIRKFDKLSDAEVASLARPRKEAIVTLRRQYKKFKCK
jgi:hypothetical protein